MAANLLKLCVSTNNNLATNFRVIARHGHHLRGKPPGIARTLKQRLDELNYKDPKLHYRVDIGLPHASYSRSEQLKKRLEILKANRKNVALEKLARNQELKINLKETKEEWLKTSGQYQIKTIADHYGIYEHLFGEAYFVPRIPLQIVFNQESVNIPVYFGNVIKPSEATNLPEISFDGGDSLWTLIMTNPDGHFTKQDAEYVHLFIGNIPGSDISKGETIVKYLQPFPPKGTGYHRYIFVLYKQDKQIDFQQLKKQDACLNLEDRTFSTLDFYREHQEYLTPAGLAFFQSNWDVTLTDFFHNTLNMSEPIFEYDFEPPYYRPQEWFPKRKAFNLYMDRYRDPKQINKEFLIRKLEKVHPFKEPEPPLQYPNALNFVGYNPSWLKLEKRKSRMKWGRINEIE